MRKKRTYHRNHSHDQEREEVFVVPLSDAVSDPRAVVVELEDAVVAHPAVCAPRGAVLLGGVRTGSADKAWQINDMEQ